MPHEDATRVVYENLPYLVVDHEGSGPTVYGPFEPGTEPSLEECTPDRRVTDVDVSASVLGLRPLSPVIPPSSSTLADQ